MSILCTQNGDLFVGTYENGIFKSSDNGNTWFGTTLDTFYVSSIVENSEHKIFAGTLSDGVYISTDNGQSWINQSEGLYLKRIKKLSCSSDGKVYAATEEGVFKYLSNTNTWYPTSSISINLESCPINAIYSWNENDVIAARANMVLASNDAGLNWPSSFLPYGINVSDITVAHTGNILLSTWYGGIYRSSELENIWEPSNSGINDNIDTDVFYNIIRDHNNNLYTGNFSGSIYKSSDNGLSWTLIGNIGNESEILCFGFNSIGHLLIGTSKGLFKTNDIISSVETPTKSFSNYNLIQNYPNPFNSNTIISYEIPTEGNIELTIYDALGRKIETLVSEKKQSGKYQVKFDASNFASGVYFYQIRTEKFISTKKMVLLK